MVIYVMTIHYINNISNISHLRYTNNDCDISCTNQVNYVSYLNDELMLLFIS